MSDFSYNRILPGISQAFSECNSKSEMDKEFEMRLNDDFKKDTIVRPRQKGYPIRASTYRLFRFGIMRIQIKTGRIS